VVGAEAEVAGAQLLRAGDRNGPDLERREHDRMPLGGLADEDEHAVAGLDATCPEQRGPLPRPPVDVRERDIANGAVAVDEPQREAVRLEPLDHVAREVEPLRDRLRHA
jgi:hypothetical protein